MTNAPTTRSGPPEITVDPLLLVAAGVGLVALALLGVGVYAVLAAFGVSFQPSGLLYVAAASVVLLAAVAAVVVYGRWRDGRPRPEVQYGR